MGAAAGYNGALGDHKEQLEAVIQLVGLVSPNSKTPAQRCVDAVMRVITRSAPTQPPVGFASTEIRMVSWLCACTQILRDIRAALNEIIMKRISRPAPAPVVPVASPKPAISPVATAASTSTANPTSHPVSSSPVTQLARLSLGSPAPVQTPAVGPYSIPASSSSPVTVVSPQQPQQPQQPVVASVRPQEQQQQQQQPAPAPLGPGCVMVRLLYGVSDIAPAQYPNVNLPRGELDMTRQYQTAGPIGPDWTEILIAGQKYLYPSSRLQRVS
eukprot:GAFH01003704.1.p1 GENE.GAFH01003704.1~~GAFH01003704.1.p1  ORF type:complete len:285 (-),score=33.24 GAFH01003704.1:42-854(-)